MRGVVAALSGLLATALLALALPVGWVAAHVASEDGYVDLTASMAHDADFRDRLVAAVADEVVSGSGVPSQLADPVRSALTRAADRVVATERFDIAWREAQRRSHRALFADPRDLPADLDQSSRLVIDVAPVAQAVVDGVAADLPVDVRVPGQLLVTIGGSDQRRLVDRIADTPAQATVLGAAAAVLALLALVAARRHGVALAWLGVGAVLAAGLVRVVGREATSQALERSTAPTDLARTTQDLLADRLLASLDQWLLVTALAGATAVVTGVVLSVRRSGP